MKLRIFTILMLCGLLAGCGSSQNQPEQQPTETAQVATEAAGETMTSVIRPLQDTTMEALGDSVLHISFAQDDFYQNESGNVFLRMQIYSYEKFDMVDISGLNAGDAIVLSGEAILVNTVERNDYGTVLVNGGLDEGGFDLATDDGGIYFVHGYSDMKSWYLVGEAEYQVSDTFAFADGSNLELGTVTFDAEAVLNGDPAFEFGFLPQNTTVRIENGLVVEMNRFYTP